MAKKTIGKSTIEDVQTGIISGMESSYFQGITFVLSQTVEDTDVPNGSIFYSNILEGLAFKDFAGNTKLITLEEN